MTATVDTMPGRTVKRPWLSPLNQRRWANFKANRRGYWSLWIFLVLFILSLFSELIANDRPIFIRLEGQNFFPVLFDYSEKALGGEFETPADYKDAFLLDHSEYMIRTFIRGPVCKGQVALNVIHDHFWVFFQDPDQDLTVRRPEFLVAQADNLRLPNEGGSAEKISGTFSDDYRDRYASFFKAKIRLYDELAPDNMIRFLGIEPRSNF